MPFIQRSRCLRAFLWPRLGIDGAKNAAYLACEILSIKYPEIAKKLEVFREKMRKELGRKIDGPETKKTLSMKESESIHRAAEIIRQGGVVALPTETVYGLGADAFNPLAVARIFEIKNRPFFDPLIVHIADPNEMSRLVIDIPPDAERADPTVMAWAADDRPL